MKIYLNEDGTTKNEFSIGLGNNKIILRRNNDILEYNIDGNWYPMGKYNIEVFVVNEEILSTKKIRLNNAIRIIDQVEIYYNGILENRYTINQNRNEITINFDFDLNDYFIVKYI